MAPDVLVAALAALQEAADAVPSEKLGAATPCAEWNVGQVLMHAAGDQHAWAATIGSAAMPAYNPFDPPGDAVGGGGVASAVRGAVEVASSTWAALNPAAATVPTPLPPVPELAPGLAAAAAALDAAVHAWDVAVATGQPSPLTDELAAQLQPAADATVEPLRGFAYGPALPASPGDGSAAALLRYVGRDPHWSPAG
ncbi:MAG TPA: maleylpyruvate isomerase family mycothiol-dependent enzyme [Aeromicrobium sp.]|nr:maleylpyruvate isomerase family mycothiol-dependent enzyme [Aeromicrobium sp.]